MISKPFPKKGEIYWVNLEPAIGAETKKLRPCLIVSNDVGNEISKIVMIAPITSKSERIYPFEVKIVLNEKVGKIMLNQCRAVDKSRIGKKLGEINDNNIHEVEKAIKIVFGLS